MKTMLNWLNCFGMCAVLVFSSVAKVIGQTISIRSMHEHRAHFQQIGSVSPSAQREILLRSTARVLICLFEPGDKVRFKHESGDRGSNTIRIWGEIVKPNVSKSGSWEEVATVGVVKDQLIVTIRGIHERNVRKKVDETDVEGLQNTMQYLLTENESVTWQFDYGKVQMYEKTEKDDPNSKVVLRTKTRFTAEQVGTPDMGVWLVITGQGGRIELRIKNH